MHFLSHYYTELPNNNPLFVVALTIPDLTPGFSKIYNSVLKNAPVPVSDDLKQVQNGILRHYAGDKKFHNSQAFIQHMELCTQSFIDAGLSRQKLRLSVISHVAVEMMIDRQIVIAHEGVCNDFYKHMDNASEDALIAFFNEYGLEEKKRDFISKFHFFKQARFLYLFKDLEKIVFGLNRVYSSVTGVEFTEQEKERFFAALRNIDGKIRYTWQEILNA